MAKTTQYTDALADHDGSAAGNYSNGVPDSGDTLLFRDAAATVQMTSGLDFSGITLANILMDQTYLGTVGTDSAYLQMKANNIELGRHYGPGYPTGSPFFKLHVGDLGSGACDITVRNSASSGSDAAEAPIILKVDYTSTILQVLKGIVGVAVAAGETSSLAELLVGFVDQPDTDAQVEIGAGVTLGVLDKNGGKVKLLCGATTIRNHRGELWTAGSGAITTLTVGDGLVVCNSTGTITTLNADGGLVDFTRSKLDRTVTTANRSAAGELRYDKEFVTVSTLNTGGPVSVRAA